MVFTIQRDRDSGKEREKKRENMTLLVRQTETSETEYILENKRELVKVREIKKDI